MYDEVTASNLVKVDLDGTILDDTPYTINQAGYTIHSAVHGARHDVKCVLHTHTEAGMGISALNCGLLPLNQGALRFYNRIGYHDYEGITENLEERERIAANLGDRNVLLMRNHGVVTCGVTVRDAFTRMRDIGDACELQLRQQAAGVDFVLPPDAVLKSFEKQRKSHDAGRGSADWPGFLRRLDQIDPSYRD